MSERFSRQDLIIPYDKIKTQHAVIIGVGAVGRNVARSLACNGIPKVTLIDFDHVEEHNCVTQGFYHDQIDKPKVEVTAEDMYRIFPKIEVVTVNGRWTPKICKEIQEEHGNFDVVFSCVDSLKIRGKIFESFNKTKGNDLRLFDCRIGKEAIRLVGAFDEESRKNYPSTITSDKDAYQVGCHQPMCFSIANIGASMLIQQYLCALRQKELYKDRMFIVNESYLADN